MQKAKQYNIADSNIANLGSDLEKKVKLEAAQVTLNICFLMLFVVNASS